MIGRHAPEQIVAMLRQTKPELARGQTIPQVCKHLGITDQNYHRWRKEFGGLRLDHAHRRSRRSHGVPFPSRPRCHGRRTRPPARPLALRPKPRQWLFPWIPASSPPRRTKSCESLFGNPYEH